MDSHIMKKDMDHKTNATDYELNMRDNHGVM